MKAMSDEEMARVVAYLYSSLKKSLDGYSIADDELGALVRRLPWGMSLTNNGDEWCVEDPVCGHSWGATPEEALRKYFESQHE